jgi:hypothetical protein
VDKTLSPKRSVSLPINEFNRALRSHSPFAENFPLNNELLQNQSRDSGGPIGFLRQRSATTSSRLYTPDKSAVYNDWSGLAPRPASSHARASRAFSEEDATAIGYAVTSGCHPHRRSRSLGHLKEAAREAERQARRRSDEIRYWRESYYQDPLSPVSFDKAESTRHEEDELKDVEQETVPEQPQPFNFGLMSEMAGMKITKAVGLEERVSSLENRVHRMEKTVSHKRRSVILQDAPKGRLARDRSSSQHGSRDQQQYLLRKASRSSSHASQSRPSTTSTNGSREELSPPHTFITSPERTPQAVSYNRPINARPATAGADLLPREGAALTLEHYTTLIALITQEQTARQRLEAQVMSLQKQLRTLQTSISPAQSYPTPSPEHGHGEPRVRSECSSFDNDDSSLEEGFDNAEVYQTPSEEHTHYGEEPFEDIEGVVVDGVSKKAPRTLSLSQLTLGKGVAVGF